MPYSSVFCLKSCLYLFALFGTVYFMFVCFFVYSQNVALFTWLSFQSPASSLKICLHCHCLHLFGLVWHCFPMFVCYFSQRVPLFALVISFQPQNLLTLIVCTCLVLFSNSVPCLFALFITVYMT